MTTITTVARRRPFLNWIAVANPQPPLYAEAVAGRAADAASVSDCGSLDASVDADQVALIDYIGDSQVSRLISLSFSHYVLISREAEREGESEKYKERSNKM